MELASAPLAGVGTASTSRSFMSGMKSGLPFFSCGRGGARVSVGGAVAVHRAEHCAEACSPASEEQLRQGGECGHGGGCGQGGGRGGCGADHADEVDDDAHGEQQDDGEDAEGDDQAHVERVELVVVGCRRARRRGCRRGAGGHDKPRKWTLRGVATID